MESVRSRQGIWLVAGTADRSVAWPGGPPRARSRRFICELEAYPALPHDVLHHLRVHDDQGVWSVGIGHHIDALARSDPEVVDHFGRQGDVVAGSAYSSGIWLP